MGYANLADCVIDLEKTGQLKRIDAAVDPYLEIAHIQRRAFAAQAPALLFTRPKGCHFPMLANLFGTRERVNFIFRDSIERVKAIFAARADLANMARKPLAALKILPGLWHMRPQFIRGAAPVLARTCQLSDLPRLVSWPEDGGPFITLPLVYTEDPERPGAANLGMYRVQMSGNDYAADEAGLHYQLQRGIGIHHAVALAKGIPLPVNIFVGGPPALSIAAVMPLPEGMNELIFAGLLGGRRMELASADGRLPVLAQCDFAIRGEIAPCLKPEGPFGDHLGYYSLRHDFPVMRVQAVSHRDNAIWPFTSVGRPPQEDTMFGDLIHELTAPMVGNVFEGIKEVHAVDAAGVHPLLLAIGSERYAAYEAARKPMELLTLAMHLLGTTQTALAKFVLILAAEDVPNLNIRDVPAFLQNLLERTDFSRDLHFFTNCTCDTLDYSGYELHEGSRLIWAAAGEKRRSLGRELASMPALPSAFGNPVLAMPGIIVINGKKHNLGRRETDTDMEALAQAMAGWPRANSFPLLVVADDADFCARNETNFLWTVFTRADPARDIYGANGRTVARHWACDAPVLVDARLKSFQARPLEDDPQIVKRVNAMAANGGPLAGLF